MNFYAFHLGDYVSATAHLTWDEDMAYRRLLDAYYSREAPIPTDQRQAYRLARASTEEQREAVDTVLAEFFEETESGWVHFRCEHEIHTVADKREKASQSAKARWSKANAKPTQSEGNANASETPCERIENECEGNAPIPIPTPKVDQKPLSSAADDKRYHQETFAEFYDAYPIKKSKSEALKSWMKLKPDAAMVATIMQSLANHIASEDWCRDGGRFIKHPSTWINQQCWDDEVITYAAGKRASQGGRPSAVDQVKQSIAERNAAAAKVVAADAGYAMAENGGDLRPDLDGEFRRVG